MRRPRTEEARGGGGRREGRLETLAYGENSNDPLSLSSLSLLGEVQVLFFRVAQYVEIDFPSSDGESSSQIY